MARCRGCAENWRTHYWPRYDGYGRCRVHERGYHYLDDPEYEMLICSEQGWCSRHPFYTTFLFAVGAFVVAETISVFIG